MMSESNTPAASASAALTSAAAPAADAAPVAAAPAVNAQAEATPTPADAAPAVESIALPGKDATPEQWAEVYAKLGRPEKADDYGLVTPEGADESFVKAVAPMLHKAGLSTQQAKIMEAEWNAMGKQAQELQAKQEAEAEVAAQAKTRQEEASLKNEWGQQFTENTEFAKRAVMQFLPKDSAADVISAVEAKLGYAETMKLFNSIGKGLGEHDAAGLGASNGAGQQAKTLAEKLYPNQK